MEISVERYHYPIGQGIFSAQIIRGPEEKYVCVYDCGSTNGSKNIPTYVKDLDKKADGKIDLLVISHFDADHVNGVKELDKIFKIEKIIIPYLSRQERILFLLNKGWQGVNRMYNPFDAKGFLRCVIKMYSNTDEGDSPYDDGLYFEDSVVEFSNREVAREVVQLHPWRLSSVEWEFLYFSVYSNRYNGKKKEFIDTFEREFTAQFSKNIDSIDANFIADNWLVIKNVYDAVFNIMKNKYPKSGKLDYNKSSIILYSGLVDDKPRDNLRYRLWLKEEGWVCGCHAGSIGYSDLVNHDDCCTYSCDQCPDIQKHRLLTNNSRGWRNYLCCKNRTGWLGTGDAYFRIFGNCYELSQKLGVGRLASVRELIVPHHGAEKNSCPAFFNLFNNFFNVICIIHSKVSSYNHPHKDIVQNIKNVDNLVPVHVTDDKCTQYNSTVYIRIF